FTAWLKEHDPAAIPVLSAAHAYKKEEQADFLLSVYLYQKQPDVPGRDASRFLSVELLNNRLPGIDTTRNLNYRSRSANLAMELLRFTWNNAPVYPVTEDFEVSAPTDPSTYHYSLILPAHGADWKFHRAWRTDKSGKTVEEYPLP